MAFTNKCKIKKAILDDNLIKPVLVNIDYRPLSNEEISKSKCCWYNSENNASDRLIQLGSTEKGSYEGSFKIKQKMCTKILVLQHKTSNKVKIVEVSECQLRKVLPKPHLQTNYENEKMELTYEENRLNLLRAFGSKKGKQVDMGARVKINQNLTVAQMDNIASGVSVDVQELVMVDSVMDSCMPICHRDATDSLKVFLLEDFLTDQELESMEDEAFTVYHLMPFTHDESGYSQCLIDSLERLQHKAKDDRIKVLLYIDALIKFLALDLQSVKRNELAEWICPFSSIIAKKIIDGFSENTSKGRVHNRIMNDKIVVHIMILVLIANDNSCNVEDLSKYLPKYSVVKLGKMARALSFSTRDKITWFIKTPLPPLKAKFIRRKK